MAEHAEGPRVIRGKGSWLEIGRQYGEELRADIARAARAIEELAMAASAWRKLRRRWAESVTAS